MKTNDDYIRVLSIFHYIVAGIAALFSLFPVIHLAVGIALASGAIQDPKAPFPIAFAGWFLIILASVFILCGLLFSFCLFLAGRYLQQRRKYMFCLVMAGIACMFMPFGTVLGVFTLILLLKDDVKAEFQATPV